MDDPADPPVVHYAEGEVHGPVHLVVADDGRIALVCTVDQMSWELPEKAVPHDPPRGFLPIPGPPPPVEADEPEHGADGASPSPSLEDSIRRLWG